MSSQSNSQQKDIRVDVVIIGGGVAGLWTLAKCQQAGFNTILLESDTLGGGQTRYAQGIIHGGTKYALTGKLTASSEAVADMPSRWRACYEGKGDVDLTSVRLMSDSHYLWSHNTLTSKISGFFASKLMRNRSAEIKAEDMPSLFQHADFKGQAYRLDEPVFDTLDIVRALAEPRMSSILSIDSGSLKQSVAAPTKHASMQVVANDGTRYQLHYQQRLFIAGQGNEDLLSGFQQTYPEMQRRPLKMVVMRGKAENGLKDRVYAHCLGASVNPRITITSHFDRDGNIVWYMGGQLAEEGVNKSNQDLLHTAVSEIQELIPWLDLSNKEMAVLDIDRAEIKQAGTSRPDSFSIAEIDGGFIAWPTKLALSPALADEIVNRLQAAEITASNTQSELEGAKSDYAIFPWDENIDWVPVNTLMNA